MMLGLIQPGKIKKSFLKTWTEFGGLESIFLTIVNFLKFRKPSYDSGCFDLNSTSDRGLQTGQDYFQHIHKKSGRSKSRQPILKDMSQFTGQ